MTTTTYLAKVHKHVLQFKKPARTSRGVMPCHTVYYLSIRDTEDRLLAVGECAPLPGLSRDDLSLLPSRLTEIEEDINAGRPWDWNLTDFPAIQFCMESIQMSLNYPGDPFILSDNTFASGHPLQINGLVWMDDYESMKEEANRRIEAGFGCIKFKVGSLAHHDECRLLEYIRDRKDERSLEIRLDANGAYSPEQVMLRLNDFAHYDIHSIEQPIPAGLGPVLRDVIEQSPIPVALDEELISARTHAQRAELIDMMNPPYLVLKPTLLGGVAHVEEWIQLVTASGGKWWATSALESNIGLNAISQWVSNYDNPLCQGLGTGSLYTNNVSGPLQVVGDALKYDASRAWEWESCIA
jgi:O-succinylbenzoate synthase